MNEDTQPHIVFKKNKSGSRLFTGDTILIIRETLSLMNEWLQSGAHIAIYQNVDLGHYNLGHIKFLKVGGDSTFQTAPPIMPDSDSQINYRYFYMGYIQGSEVIINTTVDGVSLKITE